MTAMDHLMDLCQNFSMAPVTPPAKAAPRPLKAQTTRSKTAPAAILLPTAKVNEVAKPTKTAATRDYDPDENEDDAWDPEQGWDEDWDESWEQGGAWDESWEDDDKQSDEEKGAERDKELSKEREEDEGDEHEKPSQKRQKREEEEEEAEEHQEFSQKQEQEEQEGQSAASSDPYMSDPSYAEQLKEALASHKEKRPRGGTSQGFHNFKRRLIQIGWSEWEAHKQANIAFPKGRATPADPVPADTTSTPRIPPTPPPKPKAPTWTPVPPPAPVFAVPAPTDSAPWRAAPAPIPAPPQRGLYAVGNTAGRF